MKRVHQISMLILALIIPCTCCFCVEYGSSPEDTQDETSGILRASFKEKLYDGIRLEAENGEVYTFRNELLGPFNRSYGFFNQFLTTTWLIAQEYRVDVNDSSVVDWGIVVDNEITWSADIEASSEELFGLGYMKCAYDGPDFPVYRSPSESDYITTIIIPFSNDETNLQIDSVHLHAKINAWDYGIMRFVVIDSVPGWYKIEFNSDIGYPCWVKPSENLTFLTLEEHMLDVYCVRWISFPVAFQEPSANSDTVMMVTRDQIFVPRDFTGEWMQIFNPCAGQRENEPDITGWIRWRDGNNIFINIYFLD